MRMALLIAVLVAAVGCGASQGASGSSPSTRLTISFWPEGRGSGAPTTWTLRCNPPGGTLPRARVACARLNAMQRPFAPPPKDVQCTQIYGGPQEALITGTFRGRALRVTLALRNGCEIARAERLSFLVPGFRAGPS